MARGNEPLGDVANKFLFENDRVKVWYLELEPGETSDWHVHDMDYITMTIDTGGIQVEWEDGSSEDRKTPVGQVTFRKGHGAHRVINTGATRHLNALIELK
jgi:quercetin dioxygenase-like cupin family protein